MTRTETPGAIQVSKQRRYRRLMIGFIVGGTAISIVLREVINYPLLGEAIYWLGIIGFLAVWLGTSLTLFDERDREIERQASQITLTLFAVVLVVGASAGRVLSYTDTYTMPAEIWAALWGYVALFGTFIIVYLWVRYR